MLLPLTTPPPPVRVPPQPPLMPPPALPCTMLPCTEASNVPGVYQGLHLAAPSHRRELQTAPACMETCNYASDGWCDDGGLGAEYSDCSRGTDCTDCGLRFLPPPSPPPSPPKPLSPPPSPPPLSPPPPSPPSPPPSSLPPPLLAVSTVNGITYYSGSGSSWTVPQYSPLVSYACQYNLCTITAPFDGTASNPLGNSIDFAGPNYQPLPYTYTIEMGARYTFSRWRVAGNTHYRFGQVHLKYADTSGTLVTVPGSNTDFTTIPDGEFAYGTFSSPVTASHWQVVITSYANTDVQAMFQCYLREVQLGAPSPPSQPPETASVSTVTGLTSALANTAVGHIVLAPGTYYLSAELSVTRSVIIEAAVAGSVVLDAQANEGSLRRVLNINPGSSGVVQINGLNITGGFTDEVRAAETCNYPNALFRGDHMFCTCACRAVVSTSSQAQSHSTGVKCLPT